VRKGNAISGMVELISWASNEPEGKVHKAVATSQNKILPRFAYKTRSKDPLFEIINGKNQKVITRSKS